MSDNEGSKTKRFFSVRTAFAAFRLLVRVCFVLVAIPILLVVYILSSESGTRFALTEGLVVYNGMIPGRISLAQVSGTLLEGFTLEGVALDEVTPGTIRPLIAEVPLGTFVRDGGQGGRGDA